MRITHEETVEKNSTMKHRYLSLSSRSHQLNCLAETEKQKASDKDAFLFLVVVVVPCSLVDSVIKDACITHVLDDFIQSVEF